MSLPKALIPAALLVLLIAGCGGGGDETTDAAPPATVEETTALTKDELIAQGDGICAEVNAAVGSVDAGEAEGEESPAAGVADLYTGMVDRLLALGTPTEAEGYDEFKEAAEGLSQAESDLKLAAERGDETSEAESTASSALTSFQEAATEYGFEDCGEGPSAPVAPSTGGVEEESEVAPEEVAPEEVAPEEVAPEEVAPETGGAGGTEGGGTGAGAEAEGGGTGGGIGPG